MTWYVRSRDYVGNLQSPWWTPNIFTHPTENRTPILLLQTLTLSWPVLCTEHPHRPRNERVAVCNERESCFSVGCVGSTRKTVGSLRNPETWRTPSYISLKKIGAIIEKIYKIKFLFSLVVGPLPPLPS